MFLNTDRRELGVGEGLTRSGTEETVGLGEDVGFVCDGYERGAVDAGGARVADVLATESDFSGHGRDAEGGFLGDAFDGFGYFAFGGFVGPFFLDVPVKDELATILLTLSIPQGSRVEHTDPQYSPAQ